MTGPSKQSVSPPLFPDGKAASLTVVILTKNEILHIERAVRALHGLAQRVLIVDSGSTDGTIEVSRALGADVVERVWVNYADQFQWALDHGRIVTDWVMRLDADEVVGPDLVAKLAKGLERFPTDVTGLALDLKYFVMGRWIRWGGRYPLRLVRIWRTGIGYIEQRWMDEHVVLREGRIEVVAGDFRHIDLNNLSFFTVKHDGYAAREAIDALITKYALFDRKDQASAGAMVGQAWRKRAGKISFYNRLPLGVGPLGYFVLRYVFQLGFLDGKPGLIYHILQGFWYRFLVDAKRFEFERDLANCRSNDERIDVLAKLSGHDLRAFDRKMHTAELIKELPKNVGSLPLNSSALSD